MVKMKKRTKNSRIRGARTVGWGFRQKHKGHGNKGGVGKSGTGKKADHDKQRAVASDPKGGYFGRGGLTTRGSVRKKPNQINLNDIRENFFTKEGCEIKFLKHKILGKGDGFKAKIHAKAATATAIEKMKKAGGEIVLPVKKEKVGESKDADGEKKAEE